MKSNELMISDWVYEGSNHSIQVVANYGRSVRYDEEGYSHEVEETILNPIPLTEEILKANGVPTDGSYFFYKEDKARLLELSYDDGLSWTINGAEYIILHFEYVHELQHALRLCGLTELANNFKIE